MNIPKDLSNFFNMACSSNCSVLLTGPTGTGKSTLARQIHDASTRKNRPFVSINLATLHEGVFESELFGHEKGAFTSAEIKRTGKLELAHGGTVFLDEIGDLSFRMQARLLEFLQTKLVCPVGGNREIKLDVRVIAATHKNLKQSVERKEFREDLFYRLRVLSIPLRPLRERVEDFDELIHDCLRRACEEAHRKVFKISAEVAEKFESYDWPGNIRELKNVLDYAVLSSENQEVTLKDLPSWLTFASDEIDQHLLKSHAVLGMAEVPLTLDFQDTLRRFEKEYLSRALSRNRGRVSRTARQIGLSKATLIRRIRAYGINVA